MHSLRDNRTIYLWNNLLDFVVHSNYKSIVTFKHSLQLCHCQLTAIPLNDGGKQIYLLVNRKRMHVMLQRMEYTYQESGLHAFESNHYIMYYLEHCHMTEVKKHHCLKIM